MGRKSLSELLADWAGQIAANADRAYGRKAIDVHMCDFSKNIANMVSSLSQQLAVAPVSADPDGAFADLAKRLDARAGQIGHKMTDDEGTRNRKMARAHAFEQTAAEIRAILSDYEGI